MISNDYGKRKLKRGPKSSLSVSDKRRIKTTARKFIKENQIVSAAKVKSLVNLDVSTRTIRRSLNKDNFIYHKIKKLLPLTEQQ